MRQAVSFALALVVAMSIASGTLAQDGKKQRAARLFDKGVAALEDHDYKVALDAFKGAYELMPHWRVLAHIGTCYAKLNLPVKAINALERYLEEGAADVTAEERQTAETMLAEQRNKVGTLKLVTPIAEAEAKIDGESAGRAPFGRILLLAGPHHIILVAGKEIYEADVDIEVGKETLLTLPRQEDEPAVVPAPVTESAAPAEPAFVPSVEATQQPLARTPSPAEEIAKEPEGKAPRRSGKSVAFALSLVATGLGLSAAVPGWIAFGYHNSSEKSFADVTTAYETSDGWSYDETCLPLEDGKFSVSDKIEAYYCQTEWKRRWYEDNARKALIPAILGTSVAAVGATLSVVFYLNAQWFDDDKSTGRLVLTPMITSESSGLSLVGTF